MYKRVAASYFSLLLVFSALIVNIFLIGYKVQASPSSYTANKRSVILSESRGMIYDCNMKKLVNTEEKYITVCLPTTKALNDVLPYISQESRNSLYENMANGKASVVRTEKNFDESDIKTVSEITRYSENQLCAHIIGHLDENGKGAMGLEKAYNSYLDMQSGTLKAQWEVNALGHTLYGDGIQIVNEGYLSPAGIQLTIDADIQRIAEDVLKEFSIGKGAAVVMNADTAEILASASFPSFNPLKLEEALNNPDSPFVNRAAAPYSVGSVFKPFVAAAALENNINLDINCSGIINVGSTVFGCSNYTAHGAVNMDTAMQKSCNSYFIVLGQKVGSENIINLCSSMGFGKTAELADNYYLKSGNLPSAESITSPQALANLSFGQGELTASPIQMAAAYSAFANGGIYRPPTLMKGIINDESEAIQRVRLPGGCRVMSKSTAAEIDKFLKNVVTDGNGNKAFSEFTDNHGKTATAQSGWFDGEREITHTWFCGYFHHNGTTYTAVILKEDGSSGAADCAPIFKEMSERIAELI